MAKLWRFKRPVGVVMTCKIWILNAQKVAETFEVNLNKEFCGQLKLFEMYQRAAFILRRYVEFGVGMD